MQDFKPFKQILAEGVVKIAKELAWDTFSDEQKQLFMAQAKEKQDAASAALALKCIQEAEEAMSHPDYLSHIDPSIYSKKDK